MTQMFCTLKQAADKLKTTEVEIEAMLDGGMLREFRDGPSRLLKVADLTGLAVAANVAASTRRPARAERKVGSAPPRCDRRASALLDREIKLPPASAATAQASPRLAAAPRRPSHRPQPPTRQRRIPHTVAHKPAASPRRQNPPRAVVISPELPPQRPGPQTYEMSLRQWIWTGLIDDNPLAIVFLFGIVVLGMSGVAGVVYLLTRLP